MKQHQASTTLVCSLPIGLANLNSKNPDANLIPIRLGFRGSHSKKQQQTVNGIAHYIVDIPVHVFLSCRQALVLMRNFNYMTDLTDLPARSPVQPVTFVTDGRSIAMIAMVI